MAHVLIRNFSLKWAFLLIVILPMAMISAITIFFTFKVTEKELEKQMEQQIELVARALHGPVLLELKKEKVGFETIFSSTEQIGRIYTINLFDKDGDLIWTRDAAKASVEQSLTKKTIARASSKKSYTEIDNLPVYSHFEPVIDENGFVHGLIQLTREASNIKNVTAKTKERVVLIYVFALSTILIFIILIYNTFIRVPFKNLANQLYKFDTKNLDRNQFVHIKGPREFQTIEKAFNSLYEKLFSYERTVQNEQQKQLSLQAKIRQNEKLAAIGTLAAGVAHDLGNPISAIDATVQRIEKVGQLTENQNRYLTYIKNETGRMEGIIHQLLDFSEKTGSTLEPIDLGETVAALIESFQAKHPSIDFEFSDQSSKGRVKLDRLKIRQAVTNLLGNSIEAINNGENSGRIKVELTSQEEHLILSVEDSGPGILKEDHSKVFEPFFSKGKNKTSRNKGLGLAIVHGAIQAHQGEIEISDFSNLGGVRFVITLPINI